MKKEIKQRRLDILVHIDRLDKKRCPKCKEAAVTIAHNCTCPAAVEIKQLGDALLATTSQSRVRRTNNYIEQLKEYGLSPTLYRNLREHGIDLRQMREMLGWTVKQMTEWRQENNLLEKAAEPDPEVVKRSGTIAEQRGLTLDDYLNAKKIGYLDREIRHQYKLSQFALLDFKKRNGLALPRGHNSKYRYTNRPEEVLK